MQRIKQFINFLLLPALVGLIVGGGFIVTQSPGNDVEPQNKNLLKKLLQSSDSSSSSKWSGPVSYSAAVERAAPAVVNIYTRKQSFKAKHPFFDDESFRRYFNSRSNDTERMQQTLGSGVIVNERGFILTNLHVIQGADEIAIALQDGREARAQVIGVNQERDLAVLRIPLNNLPTIAIGNATNLNVGDVVLAIGNPLGIGQTVTQGIISATQRRDLNISLFEGFLQTDAAINPGNSGGALIDAHGNLLGINVANLDKTGYSAGIGFAIPVDIAMQTLNDLIEYGRVVRGWLGVEAQVVTPDIALQLRLPVSNGILVLRVDNNGPAEKSGLRPGDVIVSINNQPTENVVSGWQRIAESRPGETVTIEFVRQNSVMKTEAVLEEHPLTKQNANNQLSLAEPS